MKVRDAMATTVRTAGPTDTIRHVAVLMRKSNAGCVPIVHDGHLVGLVTDRDIVVRCIADGFEYVAAEPVREIMTSDLATVAPEAELEDAAHVMATRHVRRLPVVEGQRLVGLLSFGDLVQATEAGPAAVEAALGVTRGA